MVDIKAYAFDYESGAYLGPYPVTAHDADPRDPGVLLLPGNVVNVEPPNCSSGLVPFWKDGQWVVHEEFKLGEMNAGEEASDVVMVVEGHPFFSEFDN